MIRIVPLKKVSKGVLRDLVGLVSELRRNPAEHRGTLADLKRVVTNKHAVMMVAQDGARIAGMGTLYCIGKIGKRVGYVEDVVVSGEYRGQGLGEKIMRALIAAARKNKLQDIFLTTHKGRAAANNLYTKLGFELVDTNPYKLRL